MTSAGFSAYYIKLDSKEGTVRHRQSKEASILLSHHAEQGSCLQKDNARNGMILVAVTSTTAPLSTALHTYLFCSHGCTFSIYLSSVILIDSSTGSPVHILMLSIQAMCGLPRLRAPGIVPCIISFSASFIICHKFLWIIVRKRLRWHLFIFTCNVYIYFCFRPFIYSELSVRWTAVVSVLVLWAVACCVYEVSISACPCLCVSGISEPTRQRSQEAAGSMWPRPSQPQVLRLRHAAGDRASD